MKLNNLIMARIDSMINAWVRVTRYNITSTIIVLSYLMRYVECIL